MKRLGWAALAASLLLVTGSRAARADDVILLGGVSAATKNLLDTGDAVTELAHYRGGYRGFYGRGFYGHGYRGFYGYGGYRGFGYGGYGFRYYSPSFAFSFGYRPFYGYRPYYSSYYRPYSYYSPYFYSAYRPYYYSQPYYNGFYSYPSYYNGYACALDEAVAANAVLLGSSPQAEPRVTPPAGNGDGTYPYNGGPAKPLPMPSAEPTPTFQPKRPTLPFEGKLVSLPAKTATVAYPAYGQTPAPAAAPSGGAQLVSLPATTSGRSVFPAYGEK